MRRGAQLASAEDARIEALKGLSGVESGLGGVPPPQQPIRGLGSVVSSPAGSGAEP